MRTLFSLALPLAALLACGGDEEGGDGNDAMVLDSADGTGNPLCAGIPPVNTAGLSCDGLTAHFDTIVFAANDCNRDSDCQFLSTTTSCLFLDVGCDFAVNTCVNASTFDQTFAAAASAMGCIRPGNEDQPRTPEQPICYLNTCIFDFQ